MISSTNKKESTLKVMEALQEEAYKGIVRIDSETMHHIDVRPGDIVEIEGSRITLGIVGRAYPTDVGQAVIRMDGILRRNAKSSIGEIVKVRKAEIKEAKQITIAPAQEGMMIQVSPEILKQGLLGRAVVKGDIVTLGGARGRRRTMSESPFFEDIFNVFEEGFIGNFSLGSIKFVVVETNPKQAVIIAENTQITVSPKAVEVTEEKVPEVTYEDLGGLDEEIKKIREMVELPLKHPEIFNRLGIEPPSGVLLHGPPGSGKTLLAKAVANESEANFMLVNGPEVMNKFYGESEKRIRDLFEEAEQKAPSIIFIDEIDAIAPKREETRGEVERRVVAQLLCLNPDTPVYLNNDIKKIKDLFDETQSDISYKENGVLYKFPKKETYVQGISSLGKISNNKILTLTKTNISNAFKISLANGSQITTSEITKFLSIDNNGVYWKNANEIKESEYILIPRKLENTTKIQKIDLLNLQEKDKWILKLKEGGQLNKLFNKHYISLLDFENIKNHNKLTHNSIKNKILNLLLKYKKLSKENIESNIKISRQSLNNYLRKLIKTKIVLVNDNKVVLNISLESLDNEILGIARKENKKIYPIKESYFTEIPKILDEDFAKFLGLLISDGNLTKYRVNIFGETHFDAYNISKKLFNKKITLDNKKPRMDIYSRPLSYFISEYFNIPIGKKSYAVKVPQLIYNSPDSVKLAFLAGLLEGDGTVFADIRFHTNSKELAYGISKLLLCLGILSKVKYYNCYTVKISGGYESFKKFSDKIIPYIKLERKKQNLIKLTQRIKKISTIVYPIKSAFKNIRDDNNIRIDDNMYRYLSPNLSFRINSEVLGYFIKKFGNIENQLIQEIRQIYNSEVIPCQVTKVEKTTGGEMYDLTTENSNFLAGDIPIVVHNTAMDGLKARRNVVVIGATNRPNAIDPALRRPGRFDREISIGVPRKEGRLDILKIHTRNMPLTEDVKLPRLAEVTHGFVGADLSILCKEAAMNVLRRLLPTINLKEKEPIPKELLEKLRVTDADFRAALKIVRPSALREVLVENPNVKWTEIGGLMQLKEDLKEAVEWPLKHAEAFKRVGIRPAKGILIYGPPGTGKTLIAKAIATEAEANFIHIKGPSLLNMWVGESERGMRKIFEKARQVAPTIVFFDEIDSIAPKRGRTFGDKVTERMVTTLLAEMDGIESLNDVVVVAATNRPDILDPALLRPGRFDKIISTKIPDKKARLDILKIHTRNMPLTKDVNLEKLADVTENYVGADIEALCREAGLASLREDIKSKEVRLKHFTHALKIVRPSISPEDLKRYTEIEEEYIRKAKANQVKPETPSYLG